MSASEEEARLAAAIDDNGPVAAAEQLAGVRRMLAAGRALQERREREQRSLVADLTSRIGASR